MFRISVLLLLGLTFGVTAEPLKLRDEGSNAAEQKIWESVEPPEDLDQSSSDIEPGMKIWRSQQHLKAEGDLDQSSSDMKIWRSQQVLKAEGDLDHLHHPSTEELLKALRETQPQQDAAAEKNLKLETHEELLEPEQDMDEVYHAEQVLQKFLAPLVAGHEGEPRVHRVHLEPERDEDEVYHAEVGAGLREEPEIQTEVQQVQGRLHLEPEDDMDEVYHAEQVLQKFLAPLVAGHKGEPRVHRVHLEPERDEDEVYHRDVPEMVLFRSGVRPAAAAEKVDEVQGRLHLEPEQDMDEVYHRDVPEMVLFRSEVRPEDEAWPTLRRHSEPEEDLDQLYHQ